MSGEVYSVRLVVQQQGSGFVGKLIDDDGQESSSFPFRLPLSEDDAAELRWYLEGFRGSPDAADQDRAARVMQYIEVWGRQFFEACFGSSQGTHVYRNLLAISAARRQVILTLSAEDRSFLAQPWELMRDQRGPLAFQGVSIRRQLVGAAPKRRQRFKPPLRVLLIVARPRGLPPIDPKISEIPIRHALEPLGSVVPAADLSQA